jgi:hypothetical protein
MQTWAVRKAHLLYKLRYVISCLANFTEEKSLLILYQFATRQMEAVIVSEIECS